MSIKIKTIKQNDGSVFIIDEDNNLYVSGNNEKGRLGIDSLEERVGKITKIEDQNLIGNVLSVNIDDTNKKYELISITTIDGDVYVAGNTGNEIIRKWTLKESILPIKGESYKILDKSLHSSHTLEIPVSEKGTYLFSVKPKDGIFTLRMEIISPDVVTELLFNSFSLGNIDVFKEHAVVKNRKITIACTNLVDGKYAFVAYDSKCNDNDIEFKEIVKFKFTNFSSDIEYDDEAKTEIESILRSNEVVESVYDIQNKIVLEEGNTFDTDDSRVISDKVSNSLNAIKVKVGLKDNVDRPFENETIKGTPWIYDLFHRRMGLSENVWYKFEGTIKRGEKIFGVSHFILGTKVGTTSDGVDIGTIQFYLSGDNRIPYSERHKEDNDRELVYAITIHPIVKDGELYQYYPNSDQVKTSVLDEMNEETRMIEVNPITEVNGILITNDPVSISSFTQKYTLTSVE